MLVCDEKLRNRHRVFRDRAHAGRLLARRLEGLIGRKAAVLAVPSGGIPVACEVALHLNLPLAAVVVRKLPVPGDPEAGIGALSFDGEVLLNTHLVERLGISQEQLMQIVSQVRQDVERRQRLFGKIPELKGREAILVDDGLASGYTMLAAVASVRKRSPARIVVAVPTSPGRTAEALEHEVDLLVCLNLRDDPVFAVADAYRVWYDLEEGEALKILRRCQEKKRRRVDGAMAE